MFASDLFSSPGDRFVVNMMIHSDLVGISDDCFGPSELPLSASTNFGFPGVCFRSTNFGIPGVCFRSCRNFWHIFRFSSEILMIGSDLVGNSNVRFGSLGISGE